MPWQDWIIYSCNLKRGNLSKAEYKCVCVLGLCDSLTFFYKHFKSKTFSHTVITSFRYFERREVLSFNEHQRKKRRKKASIVFDGLSCGLNFEDRKSSEITTRNYNMWADVMIVREERQARKQNSNSVAP